MVTFIRNNLTLWTGNLTHIPRKDELVCFDKLILYHVDEVHYMIGEGNDRIIIYLK